ARVARRVLREPRVRSDRALASRIHLRGVGSSGRRRDHGRLPPSARAGPAGGFPRFDERQADRRLQLGRKPLRVDARARGARRLRSWPRARMVEIPVIDTERLRLTAFDERHFEAYASMLGDPTSTRFVGDGEPLDRMNAWRSMAMLLGHWQLRGFGMWAM